jgi:hypothetical protein
MMTETECIDTFTALKKICEEQELGWLVEAVQQEIQEGLIQVASGEDLSREPMAKSAHETTEASYRRSVKGKEFLVRRDFSASQRLLLLVDAIDEVVSEAVEIERDVLKHFREHNGPRDFEFVGRAEPVAPITVNDDSVKGRSLAAVKLHDLFDQVRKDISQ